MQPPIEVARAVCRQTPKDAEEDILTEILSVASVASQAIGESIDLRRMQTHDLIP